MQFRYETERLVLMSSRPSFAEMVAAYLTKNRNDFEQYDKHYGDNVYTADYQRHALESEEELFLRDEGVRYYIFSKEKPGVVIGNVSFAYLNCTPRPCSIGYKIDRDYRQKGYAYEAASFLIPHAFFAYDIDQIEAEVLPDNTASLALIKKLGFEYKGINKNAHEIMGVKRDHLRFVLSRSEQPAFPPGFDIEDF